MARLFCHNREMLRVGGDLRRLVGLSTFVSQEFHDGDARVPVLMPG